MANEEIKRLINGLSEEKKRALTEALEKQTAIKAESIADKAAADPKTAEKINKLASKIDVKSVETIASDPDKLKVLLMSPQIKNLLKSITG